jgi:hypothetical protein
MRNSTSLTQISIFQNVIGGVVSVFFFFSMLIFKRFSPTLFDAVFLPDVRLFFLHVMSALIPRAVHYAFALLTGLSLSGLVYAWSDPGDSLGSYGLMSGTALVLCTVLGLWGYYAWVITRRIRQMWSDVQAGKQALDRQLAGEQAAALALHLRLTALGAGLEQIRTGHKPDMDALTGMLLAATASRQLSIWQADFRLSVGTGCTGAGRPAGCVGHGHHA